MDSQTKASHRPRDTDDIDKKSASLTRSSKNTNAHSSNKKRNKLSSVTNKRISCTPKSIESDCLPTTVTNSAKTDRDSPLSHRFSTSSHINEGVSVNDASDKMTIESFNSDEKLAQSSYKAVLISLSSNAGLAENSARKGNVLKLPEIKSGNETQMFKAEAPTTPPDHKLFPQYLRKRTTFSKLTHPNESHTSVRDTQMNSTMIHSNIVHEDFRLKVDRTKSREKNLPCKTNTSQTGINERIATHSTFNMSSGGSNPQSQKTNIKRTVGTNRNNSNTLTAQSGNRQVKSTYIADAYPESISRQSALVERKASSEAATKNRSKKSLAMTTAGIETYRLGPEAKKAVEWTHERSSMYDPSTAMTTMRGMEGFIKRGSKHHLVPSNTSLISTFDNRQDPERVGSQDDSLYHQTKYRIPSIGGAASRPNVMASGSTMFRASRSRAEALAAPSVLLGNKIDHTLAFVTAANSKTATRLPSSFTVKVTSGADLAGKKPNPFDNFNAQIVPIRNKHERQVRLDSPDMSSHEIYKLGVERRKQLTKTQETSHINDLPTNVKKRLFYAEDGCYFRHREGKGKKALHEERLSQCLLARACPHPPPKSCRRHLAAPQESFTQLQR